MNIDPEKLEIFENGLNPAFPQQSAVVPDILGYGEISSTFSIPDMPDIAFKRMPPFDTTEKIGSYRTAVDRYCTLLAEKCGIDAAPCLIHDLVNRHGEQIVYVAQPRLPSRSIGNQRLVNADFSELEDLLMPVIESLLHVWRHNRNPGEEEQLGIDGQISNWSLVPKKAPVYFDVTTPLFRINGIEQLDTEIFLKSCPGFLVWLVRWQFLQEVLDRYYDTRLVLIDLVANFHKEGRADLIDSAIRIINQTLGRDGLDDDIPPLDRAEVDRYYKNDAFIWRLFLSLRRLDRFLRTRAAGKRYNFILPGNIRR